MSEFKKEPINQRFKAYVDSLTIRINSNILKSLDRANHTGTQSVSTINDLDDYLEEHSKDSGNIKALKISMLC